MNSQIKKLFPQVTRMQDAKSGLTVHVTSADVRMSKRKKHAECAMAVACKRKFHADGMLIGRQTAYLIKGSKAVRFSFPESVRKEIVAFDRGASFEPGTYRLTKPRRSKYVPVACVDGNNNPGKHARLIHITENIRVSLNEESSL